MFNVTFFTFTVGRCYTGVIVGATNNTFRVTDTAVSGVLSVARIAQAVVWRNTVTIHTWW
jgi:hypothetical protein